MSILEDEILAKASEVKEKILKFMEEAKHRTISASSGGGMVTATVNLRMELVNLVMEKEVVNPDDMEMLSDLVVSAVNEALSEAQATVTSELHKISGSNYAGPWS
ncbi:MAG: YbaB/EbfC family nucleoid-associated protein [Deltaproteobacteria bacterium]|jgi:DNA-binding YbaB/EbfC family protein|nr:YbaB/EbfC family nucleoid-associated protein [Deltaproteobacteria bacterium]